MVRRGLSKLVMERQIWIINSIQFMGACTKKMGRNSEISPQHYENRASQRMNTSHVSNNELPIKHENQHDPVVTYKLLEPTQEPPFEGNDAEFSDPEDYREVTKAKIVKKPQKYQRAHPSTRMGLKKQSDEKAKLVTGKEVTFNPDVEELEPDSESQSEEGHDRITLGSIGGNAGSYNEHHNLAEEKTQRPKRRSIIREEKENRYKCKSSSRSPGRAAVARQSALKKSLKKQKPLRLGNKESWQELADSKADVIHGTAKEGVNGSRLTLRTSASNYQFVLPRSQAGPLVVSRMQYQKYIV